MRLILRTIKVLATTTAVTIGIVFVAMVAGYKPTKAAPRALLDERREFVVLTNGDTEHEVRYVTGKTETLTFCEVTPFYKGMLVDLVRFEQRKDCKSLMPKGTGYWIRSDENGYPIMFSGRRKTAETDNSSEKTARSEPEPTYATLK